MDVALPAGGRSRLPRVLGLVAGAAVAIGDRRADGWAQGADQRVAAAAEGRHAAALLDEVGARVLRVTKSGDGGLIDVRYQVVDADKANAIHNAKYPPALVDEHSGQVIGRLLMGHAHTGTFHAGVTYYVAFENPGGLVKRGDPVSVVLGPLRLQHVRVQ